MLFNSVLFLTFVLKCQIIKSVNSKYLVHDILSRNMRNVSINENLCIFPLCVKLPPPICHPLKNTIDSSY